MTKNVASLTDIQQKIDRLQEEAAHLKTEIATEIAALLIDIDLVTSDLNTLCGALLDLKKRLADTAPEAKQQREDWHQAGQKFRRAQTRKRSQTSPMPDQAA